MAKQSLEASVRALPRRSKTWNLPVRLSHQCLQMLPSLSYGKPHGTHLLSIVYRSSCVAMHSCEKGSESGSCRLNGSVLFLFGLFWVTVGYYQLPPQPGVYYQLKTSRQELSGPASKALATMSISGRFVCGKFTDGTFKRWDKWNDFCFVKNSLWPLTL